MYSRTVQKMVFFFGGIVSSVMVVGLGAYATGYAPTLSLGAPSSLLGIATPPDTCSPVKAAENSRDRIYFVGCGGFL